MGGQLVVGTTNVLDAIATAASSGGGTTLDSSSEVEVDSVTATSVALSGNLFADRVYANIYFVAASGADHTFCDSEGRSRLLLGSASNTFLYGLTAPSLTASGTVVANNIESQGLTLKNSTSSDQSMTIQSGGESKDAILYFSTPYNPSSAPLNCAIIVEGRSNYSRNNLHICLPNSGIIVAGTPVSLADSCLKITPHDKHVSIPGSLSVTGSFSNSDSSIKENVRALASSDALDVLRTVEAKVYDRTDGPLGTRVGFIAQHVQSALPLEWQNVVRSTSVEAETDSEGRVVKPAGPGLLQIDHSRMGSPILWECCRNMLARIESLEARLQ